MGIRHIGARRALEMTEAGYENTSREKWGVFCLFGEAWGEYIFTCALNADHAAKRFKREKGDGTRIIQIPSDDEGIHHKCIQDEDCRPLRILYKSGGARTAKLAIDRALVAGYNVVIL